MATKIPCRQGGCRILVVDDDEDVCELLRTGLEMAGFVVETELDGSQAVRRLHRDPVDLAIIDVRLPGAIDGLEIARRGKAQNPLLKVLFISGRTIPPWDREQDEFVTKPFQVRELVGCVFQLLGRVPGDMAMMSAR